MGLIGGFVGRGRVEWSGGERRGGIECLLSSVVELKGTLLALSLVARASYLFPGKDCC